MVGCVTLSEYRLRGSRVNSNERIKVLVVDDHSIVREGRWSR